VSLGLTEIQISAETCEKYLREYDELAECKRGVMEDVMNTLAEQARAEGKKPLEDMLAWTEVLTHRAITRGLYRAKFRAHLEDNETAAESIGRQISTNLASLRTAKAVAHKQLKAYDSTHRPASLQQARTGVSAPRTQAEIPTFASSFVPETDGTAAASSIPANVAMTGAKSILAMLQKTADDPDCEITDNELNRRVADIISGLSVPPSSARVSAAAASLDTNAVQYTSDAGSSYGDRLNTAMTGQRISVY
jgi:hypothetical protein